MSWVTRPDNPSEDEDRRARRIYVGLGYATLAASTVLTVTVDADRPAGWMATTLGLSALAAVWLAGMVPLYSRRYRSRPAVLVFYLGLLAIGTVLVARSQLFTVFASTGYLYAFALFPARWAVFAVAATAVSMATAQGAMSEQWLGNISPYLLIFGVAGPVIFAGWAAGVESDKRRQANTELAQTNAKLAATLAENAGLHAQLLAQAREAGVLDERQRMAREIHDTLAQGLTGIITQLEAAGQASTHQAQWQRHLDNAAQLARESLSEARRSVHAVRPEPLETARLPEALAEVARRWTALNGIPAEVVTTGTPRPMHPEVDVTLLRTAQEALANVAKHAHASRVGLTLSYMEDLVTLDVRDDGVGFDPRSSGPSTVAGGFGLTAMRQRVSRLHGTLELESEPGGGTAISASIPAVPGGGEL